MRVLLTILTFAAFSISHAQLSPFYNMDSTWYFSFKSADTNPLLVEKLRVNYPRFRHHQKCHAKTYFAKLKQYPNLKYLDLSGLTLKEIPKEVLALKNLKALNLSYTHLTDLPDNFKQLENLEYLLLNGVHFKTFPRVVAELHKLRCLQFTDLPKLIDPYQSLQMICAISTLEELQFINFKLYSTLNEIPCEITNLKRLRFLHVESRTLKKDPDCLGELKNLEHLWFGSPLSSGGTNVFKKYPKSLCELPKLTHLMLNDIIFEEFPKEFANLKNLHYFSLQLPETMDTQSLNCFRDMDLISLDLHLSYKTKYLPSQFCEIKRLKGLHILTVGNITLPENMGELHNLENLGLYIGPIEVLPTGFCKLTKLKKLVFGMGCQLTKLPECFVNLDNLEILDLGNCPNLKWPILLNPHLEFKYLNLKMEYGNKFYPSGPKYPYTPDPIYEWQFIRY